MVLPNQLSEENSKVLGLGYDSERDNLHLMIAVNFSKKKKKMKLGENLSREEVRTHVLDPLNRRGLFSQVSGLYDFLSLATPVKQKGVESFPGSKGQLQSFSSHMGCSLD